MQLGNVCLYCILRNVRRCLALCVVVTSAPYAVQARVLAIESVLGETVPEKPPLQPLSSLIHKRVRVVEAIFFIQSFSLCVIVLFY